MKKAGDLLSVIFDEKLLKKARGYSDLFSSWEEITQKKGIPAAAAHSRVVELERFVLLVEADHPGWIQLLQTKQRELLTAVQRRFPELTITGISFRLSRAPLSRVSRQDEETGEPGKLGLPGKDRAVPPPEHDPEPEVSEPVPEAELADLYKRIDDDDFKLTLKRLEQGIRKGRPPKKKT
jgi:hypothetical protein